MKIFDNANKGNGWKCPICNTNDDGKVALVAISGTERDGIVECAQIHLDCINLTYTKSQGYALLSQVIDEVSDG